MSRQVAFHVELNSRLRHGDLVANLLAANQRIVQASVEGVLPHPCVIGGDLDACEFDSLPGTRSRVRSTFIAAIGGIPDLS